MEIKDFSSEKFDIFIQAGQSNSEGFGLGFVEDPYWVDERVWYLTQDMLFAPASENVMANEIQGNYSLSFARKYIHDGYLAEGRKLLILRTSVGSTGFLSGHWNQTGECYLRMLSMCRFALSLNLENRIKGLLWHQGENDVADRASYEIHYGNLMELLNSVRREISVPNLPFIAGDFTHHWKNDNMERCIPIVNAIRTVCQDDLFAAFVETDGLKSNKQELGRKTQCGKEVIEDTIHFSRPSLYQLGERYFEAYKNILMSNSIK